MWRSGWSNLQVINYLNNFMKNDQPGRPVPETFVLGILMMIPSVKTPSETFSTSTCCISRLNMFRSRV